MTDIRTRLPRICLAPEHRSCYTPAAMAAMTSAPQLVIHVLTEELHTPHREEAISQLATALARKAGLPDAARALVDSALERENCEPTYLGKGMALPHARLAGGDTPFAGVCVAHSVAGIPWHDERAHLIIFLSVPESQPELYLQLMSKLVRWRLRLEDGVFCTASLPAGRWEAELEALLAS